MDHTEQAAKTLRVLGPPTINLEAVQALLRLTDPDTRAVTGAIETCPTLAARLLSIGTSAVLGVSWKDSTIANIVNLLGGRRARSVALAYTLRNLMRSGAIPTDQAENIYEASIRKALAARLYCEAVEPVSAEIAYALGLIQDVGLAMLMGVNRNFYHEELVLEDGMGGASEEIGWFGMTHGAVTQARMMGWDSAEGLQKLLLHHHDPPPADADPLQMAVYVASLFPHLGGSLGARNRVALERIHERDLRGVYGDLDTFIERVNENWRLIRERYPHSEAPLRASLIPRLIAAVTSEAIVAETQLCRIEEAYRGQLAHSSTLREQAVTDALTRLLNRRGFLDSATRQLELAHEEASGICVMIFDIDGLKALNDRHGHEFGDQFLRGFAKLLRRYLDEDDLISRFGGDEFAAIICNVDSKTARQVARRISGQLNGSRLRLTNGLKLQVSCSIGAVQYDTQLGPPNVATLLNLADHTMYRRKHGGKGGLAFRVFVPQRADAGPTGGAPQHADPTKDAA